MSATCSISAMTRRLLNNYNREEPPSHGRLSYRFTAHAPTWYPPFRVLAQEESNSLLPSAAPGL